MRESAIYAGTFDPITLGHLDLAQRASSIFRHVVLAVADSTSKGTLFPLSERVEMAEASCTGLENVRVVAFDGLLVEFARAQGIHVVVRGLRAFSDFEYEFQMALTNRKLAPDIETIFMMPNESYSYVSSSIIREVAKYGGEAGAFVPAPVVAHLERLRRGD